MKIGVCVTQYGGYGDIIAALELVLICQRAGHYTYLITMPSASDDEGADDSNVVRKIQELLGDPIEPPFYYTYKNSVIKLVSLYHVCNTMRRTELSLFLENHQSEFEACLKRSPYDSFVGTRDKVIPDRLIVGFSCLGIVSNPSNMHQYLALHFLTAYREKLCAIEDACDVCCIISSGQNERFIPLRTINSLTFLFEKNALGINRGVMLLSIGLHTNVDSGLLLPTYLLPRLENAQVNQQSHVSLIYPSIETDQKLESNILNSIFNDFIAGDKSHTVIIITKSAFLSPIRIQAYLGSGNNESLKNQVSFTVNPDDEKLCPQYDLRQNHKILHFVYYSQVVPEKFDDLLCMCNHFILSVGFQSLFSAIVVASITNALVIHVNPRAEEENEFSHGFRRALVNYLQSSVKQELHTTVLELNDLLQSLKEIITNDQINRLVRLANQQELVAVFSDFYRFIIGRHNISTAIETFLSFSDTSLQELIPNVPESDDNGESDDEAMSNEPFV